MSQKITFSILGVCLLLVACGAGETISFKGVPLDQPGVKDALDKICQEIHNSHEAKAALIRKAAVISLYKAHHILVTTEAEAKDIIAKLKKDPASFKKLAMEKSRDPGSKFKGGDLGWIDLRTMVPEFRAGVAMLAKGKFTEDPVNTQFGFHVIFLEDIKLSEEAKPIDAQPMRCSYQKGRSPMWISYGTLSERPAWITLGKDDSLVEIEITGTKGEMLGQVETLTAKYGNPSRIAEQVTNGFGTKFDREIYTWSDSRGSRITVESIYDKIDEGRIVIDSASSVAAKKNAEKLLIKAGKENL